ncbi:hypothetical protein [Solidesulfovibrio magneticus]|uniref:hypothetical protein n=1 Tax=Solidesulfovibrio magneticus TaxID=184917 RepID=UPI0002EA4018|nr:hypothetical protein [Solidesulfovibrio magneticus]
MSATIMRRLAAVEAAANPKAERLGNGLVVDMQDGRWFGGQGFHDSEEAACRAADSSVVIIVTPPLSRTGVLSALFNADSGVSPEVQAELFGEAEGAAPH